MAPVIYGMIAFPTATQADFARFYDDPHYWLAVGRLGVAAWREHTGDAQVVYYYPGMEPR